jgi:hypothetical protein
MSDAGYAQRTDLLAPKAAPGQTYGEAAKQLAAQRAVPMGNPTPTGTPRAMAAPGSMGALDRSSERLEEPVTSGNPLGAGPGAEILPQPLPADLQPGSKQDLINQVRYIYSKFPSTPVLQLLIDLENSPL